MEVPSKPLHDNGAKPCERLMGHAAGERAGGDMRGLKVAGSCKHAVGVGDGGSTPRRFFSLVQARKGEDQRGRVHAHGNAQ
jgi:hypothetical protein